MTGERQGELATNKTSVPKRSPSFLIRRSEAIDTWLNYFGMVFILLLMLMTLVNVIGRLPILNRPFKGYFDALEMMMALLVFLCLAYCQLKNGNIRFELFMTRVLRERRAYHLAEVFYLLIALTGFAMIAIYSLQTAIHSYAIQDVTPSVHWPIWPAHLGTAVGSIFLCVRLLIQIIQNATWAVTGTKLPGESNTAIE